MFECKSDRDNNVTFRIQDLNVSVKIYLTKGFDFESLCFNDIPFILLILHFVEHNSFNILDMRWNKWLAEIKINMSNTMGVL